MNRIKRLLINTGWLYRFASGCYQLIRRVAGWLFCLFPIDPQKVVLDNFSGKGWGGFPARIAEAMREEGLGRDFVWLAEGDPGALPEGVRCAAFGSLRALYETVTAGVWLDNVMGALNAPKRKGQLYINTWHGGGIGLKQLEAAVESQLEKVYVRGAKKDARKIDYLLSSTRWQNEMMNKSFWYQGPKLPVEYYGVKTEEERCGTDRQVREYFGLSQDVSLVLYAPTFRKDKRTDCYDIDFPALLSALEQRFGGKWKALVRLHPNVAALQDVIAYSDDIINATPYPDIDDLIYACGLLITDFSSSFFDAMRYGKRSLLYASDYDAYVANERPLCFDIRTLPPPFAGDNAALLRAVAEFDDEAYREASARFTESVGYYSDKKDLSAVLEVLRAHMEK